MDNYGMKVQATVDLPSAKKVDEQIRALEKSISKLKVSGKFDDVALKNLTNQLNTLKATVASANFSPTALKELASQVENALKSINIPSIGIDTKSGVKAGQDYGKQISQGISQGMSSASKSTEKVLRDFSELNDAKRKFVDGHDLISKDDIADAERLYDTVRKAFSEFGQVTVSKGSMNDGSLENMRVKIEQVNGEMKITRDFMLYFNESKNGFRLVDDDTIRTTEKMVQHLNEEKNIINATNEEANAIKAKLAEQEKYYKNIKNEVNTLYNLKTKLLSADELQTAELEKQIKQTKERISYNNKQIDKKDLRDNSLDRQINDLEVAKQKQLDLASAKSQDIANTKELAQAEREVATALKERQSIEAQANKIQLSMDNGAYESKVESLIAKTRQWTDVNGETRISTNELSEAFETLKNASNNYANSPIEANQKSLIAAEKELDKQIKTVTNSVRSMNAELAKDSAVSSLHNQLADFMGKNGKTMRHFGTELKDIFNQTAQGSKLTNQELTVLKQRFIDVQNTARATGKLGKTWFQTLREGMSSFSYWTSSTFLVMKGIQEIKKAVTFAKELDSALVNINYTMDVTASQLENIGNKSIEMAKDLNTSAENVLGAVKLYANAKETADSILQKAQPAIMLSNVTGFSGEQSAKYLQTIMNQFDLTQDDLMNISDTIQGVSQSMAHDFSDGIVQINEGIATSGEVARAAGMDLSEYASMIGLLVEKTGLAGSQLGNSLKTIITRTTKAGEILGIDEGEISAAETSLRSIGVEVRKTDGEFNAFNDTMSELAKQWDTLSDVEKSNISFNLAGTRQINVIQTLLRNWSEYEELVNKANNSTGVTFENQEKYAASLEGKLKELSATTTSIGDNIFKSDDLSVIVSGLTKIAGLFDTITSKTKLLGTIGLGAGLFAGVKNLGQCA